MLVVFNILENDEKELYDKQALIEEEDAQRDKTFDLGLSPSKSYDSFFNNRDTYVKFTLDMKEVKYFREKVYYYNNEKKVGVGVLTEDQLFIQPIDCTFEKFKNLFEMANPERKIIYESSQ